MGIERLLCDMDGVLSDFIGHLCRYSGIKCEWKIPGNFSIEENLGIKNEDIWKYTNYDFWATAPKTQEADEIVDLILTHYGPKRIAIVTLYPSCYGYPIERINEYNDGKMEWIKRNYPFMLDHFWLGNPKYFFAGPNVTLLDDSESNIKEFQNYGGKTIIVPRPWNSMFVSPVIPYLKMKLKG